MRLDARRFYAEKIGELVTDRLMENFDNLMDYSFTANMEEELDKIAHGQSQWDRVLDEFYGDFSDKLVSAKDAENGMRDNAPTDTNITCPAEGCGRLMQIRNGSTGVFLRLFWLRVEAKGALHKDREPHTRRRGGRCRPG